MERQDGSRARQCVAISRARSEAEARQQTIQREKVSIIGETSPTASRAATALAPQISVVKTSSR